MEFSFTWFIVGLIVTIGGIVFVRYYKQIADNFGWGVASYQKYKMIGAGVAVAGIIIMFNLHTIVLNFIGQLFFGSVMNQ